MLIAQRSYKTNDVNQELVYPSFIWSHFFDVITSPRGINERGPFNEEDNPHQRHGEYVARATLFLSDSLLDLMHTSGTEFQKGDGLSTKKISIGTGGYIFLPERVIPAWQMTEEHNVTGVYISMSKIPEAAVMNRYTVVYAGDRYARDRGLELVHAGDQVLPAIEEYREAGIPINQDVLRDVTLRSRNGSPEGY